MIPSKPAPVSLEVTFGDYLRIQRLRHQISGRELARQLALSAVYVSQVERSIKGPLSPRHWRTVANLIPSITEHALFRLFVRSERIPFEISDLKPQSRRVLNELSVWLRTADQTDRHVRKYLVALANPEFWPTQPTPATRLREQRRRAKLKAAKRKQRTYGRERNGSRVAMPAL